MFWLDIKSWAPVPLAAWADVHPGEPSDVRVTPHFTGFDVPMLQLLAGAADLVGPVNGQVSPVRLVGPAPAPSF